MITKNNEIIAEIRDYGPLGIENIGKIGFKIGVTREEHEAGSGPVFGKPIHYIESAGVYFAISEDSFERIASKISIFYEVEEMKKKEKTEEEKAKDEAPEERVERLEKIIDVMVPKVVNFLSKRKK